MLSYIEGCYLVPLTIYAFSRIFKIVWSSFEKCLHTIGLKDTQLERAIDWFCFFNGMACQWSSEGNASFSGETSYIQNESWSGGSHILVTFHMACHVSQIMTHANHITRQHETWLHRVTCPRRIGFFLPGQVKEGHGLQGQSRHAPCAVGIVDFVLLYIQTTVYIYMTDDQSDSSVMTRPSHRARHPPPVPRKSYFGIVWLKAVVNDSHKMCVLL